ncbi:MAG: AI-2E family transporter [Haloarculaceae archaeon]
MSPDLSDRRLALLGILLALVGVAAVVLYDVIGTVFFAITVAYVLYPVRQWLARRGVGRRVSAAIATLAGFLAVVVIVAPIVAAVYGHRQPLLDFVRQLPAQIPVAAFGFEYVVDVSHSLQLVQRSLTGIAVNVATVAPVIGLKAALFVLLVYALLLQPHNLRAAVLELVPPTYHDVALAFHDRVRSTLYAIYVLQAATAFGTFLIAWAVFAGLGYKSALVLAVLAGLLQFIPIVGPSFLVAVLAVYQLTVGNVPAAILVTSLGLVLVGFLPDALIRPRLASITAGMPGSLYFVGFTGGVLTVGLVGFIAGPLAVGLVLEASNLLAAETGVEPAVDD